MNNQVSDSVLWEPLVYSIVQCNIHVDHDVPITTRKQHELNFFLCTNLFSLYKLYIFYFVEILNYHGMSALRKHTVIQGLGIQGTHSHFVYHPNSLHIT